jgi:hypothetical protein
VTLRRFAGVHVTVEPADRSVGIMAESFAAWPIYSDDKNDEGPWCELLDCATGEVRWEDSDTGATIDRPVFGAIVEATLRAFVDAFYAQESDQEEPDCRDPNCSGCSKPYCAKSDPYGRRAGH